MKSPQKSTLLLVVMMISFAAFLPALQSGVGGGGQSNVGGGGGGTPGGANGQLQYNNNGAFGGAGGLTTSGTTSGTVLQVNDSGANAMILANGTTGVLTLGRPTQGGITISGSSGAITLGTLSRLLLKDQGSCTMAAGTCTAQSLGSTYTVAPLGFLTWTGGGTCAGPLKVATTTTTITPSSNTGTDTCVVNWFTLGN